METRSSRAPIHGKRGSVPESIASGRKSVVRCGPYASCLFHHVPTVSNSLSVCNIITYILSYTYYNAAHVSTIWFLYIDHTRDTVVASAVASASDSYDTCILYIYMRIRAYVNCVSSLWRRTEKKSVKSENAAHPLRPGIGFRCYTGVATVYSGQMRSDHQKRNMLVSTVLGTTT